MSGPLQEHVEKFAEDKAEFHNTFKSGFVKLCDLGQDSSSLIDIDNFVTYDQEYMEY